MAIAAKYPVEIDGDGVPRIEGTVLRVMDVVRMQQTLHMTPEQIQAAVPLLSLDQINGALAYYYANQQALDAETERQRQKVEEALSRIQPRNQLPPGQTWLDQVWGKWLGEETDEEIEAALEKLS